MKIGILTHHMVVNFGAYLQAYSVQEAVKKLRPDAEVEIINYIPIKHFIINTFGWFLWYKNRQNWKNWNNIFRLPFTLKRERSKHMNLSPICFSSKAISRLGYDLIVVGSDEVWNYSDSKSVNPIKFGHGLESSRLISYAPSAGNSNIENIPEIVSSGLSKFSYISARDSLTVKLAEKITGKKIQEVLDPTFLYPLPSEPNPYLPDKKYILFYYCEHLPQKLKEQIFKYAKDNDFAILGAGDSDKDYEECTVNMTPFQWIDMFRHASFVFTGTFHGAVFSVLNHCQFKVYLTNKGRIAKVGALLNSLGIENRMMTDDYVFDFSTQKHEIDYSLVDKSIAEKREMSIKYLKDALS